MSQLKVIAKELGTSPSTVSRALRNDPRISEAMRRQVANASQRLGYRPDQTIAAAMRRVRSKSDYVTAVIGLWWPGNWNEAQLLEHYPNLRGVLAAIRTTAASLHLACQTRDGLPTQPEAALRILRNRGVRGLLLLPGNPEVYRMPEAFEKLATVAVGNAIQGKVRSRVTPHFEDAYARIFQELHERGYRRPAVIVRNQARDERLYEARYLGAYEHACRRLGFFEPTEPLWIGDYGKDDTAERLANWLREQQADAVVTPYPQLRNLLNEQTMRGISGALGWVATGTTSEFPEVSGPLTNTAALGRESVYALNNRLHATLSDDVPDTRLLIKSTWHEGKTLPVIKTLAE